MILGRKPFLWLQYTCLLGAMSINELYYYNIIISKNCFAFFYVS